jgi:hypothetical protein
MEKILFISNGLELNMEALDFTCYLGRLTRSRITGVFLENLLEDARPVLEKVYGHSLSETENKAYEEKKQMIANNIKRFEEACASRSVRSGVREDFGIPPGEVLLESRYADLAVISPDTSFNSEVESLPTNFVKRFIEKSECPVVIAPQTFREINEIVFTYNGSSSSVYAIKQFTYLFPVMDDLRVTILGVNGKDLGEKEKNQFRGWLQNHYNAIGFEFLQGNPEAELFKWLQTRKNAFVTMGAYGRSVVSQFFRRSTAELLIKTLPQPIFITHF